MVRALAGDSTMTRDPERAPSAARPVRVAVPLGDRRGAPFFVVGFFAGFLPGLAAAALRLVLGIVSRPFIWTSGSRNSRDQEAR